MTGPNTLTLLQSVTTTLTGGNILLNRDGGTPMGVGSVLTFPASEGFADRLLDPGECVTVTYKIGLASDTVRPFFVDVAGGHCGTGAHSTSTDVAQTTGVSANKKGDKRPFRLVRRGS